MNIGYSDILALPHPVSHRHPPMPQSKRAAQFAPFAALNGYEEAIDTTLLSHQEYFTGVFHHTHSTDFIQTSG